MNAASEFWESVQADKELRRLDSWPEGETLRSNLRRWAGTDQVLDFGCGFGRLASLFDHDGYLGLDVSQATIEEARRRHPLHAFERLGEALPMTRPVGIASSVLQHIDDDTIAGVLLSLSKLVERLLVVECLGRSWRSEFSHNREFEDYASLGHTVGWRTATVLGQWRSLFVPHPEITAFLLAP